MEHSTEELVCWCDPRAEQVCPVEPHPVPCETCGGRGWVAAYDVNAPTVIIHRDMEYARMTTIAWDGLTLAADTLMLHDNVKSYVDKAFRLADGRLFAGAGDYQDVIAVRDWLEQGGDKPQIDEGRLEGILIDAERHYWRLEHKLIAYRMTGDYLTLGSGRDFALAALTLGKTAYEAVRLACQFDAYTGGHITQLSLKEN